MIIKAIRDFADGNLNEDSKEDRQKLAARNAAEFVLNTPGNMADRR
jgi:hypothetical protein